MVRRRGRAVAVTVLLFAFHVAEGFAAGGDASAPAEASRSHLPQPAPGNAPAITKLRLDWRVPSACLDVDAFRHHISELTPRVEWSSDATRVAAVTMQEHGVAALLEVFDDGQLAWRRVIQGRWDCATMARALAFSLAVAVDPDASIAALSVSSEAPATHDHAPPPVMMNAAPVNPAAMNPATNLEPNPEPPPAVSARDRVIPQPVNTLTPPPHPSETDVSTERVRPLPLAEPSPLASGVMLEEEEASEPAFTRDIWFGVGPMTLVGVGDTPGLGASALITSRTPRASSPGVQWLPDVGVGASYFRLEESVESVTAKGEVWTADLRLRPIAWTALQLGWFLGAGWTVGALSVRAENVEVSQRRTALWSAAEANVGVQIGGAAATVDLTLGVSWQLSQPHFLVQRTADDATPRQLLAIPGPAFVARLFIFLSGSRSDANTADIGRLE